MRAALAIIAGIIVAFAVQSGIDWISYQFYPAVITNMWDRQQVSEAMATRPTGALLLTVLGYLLGGLAGGAVAKLIHRRSWVCWVPVGIFAATALILVLAYPIAEWAGFGAFVAGLVGGLIANHLVADRVVVGVEADAAVAPAAGDPDDAGL